MILATGGRGQRSAKQFEDMALDRREGGEFVYPLAAEAGLVRDRLKDDRPGLPCLR